MLEEVGERRLQVSQRLLRGTGHFVHVRVFSCFLPLGEHGAGLDVVTSPSCIEQATFNAGVDLSAMTVRLSSCSSARVSVSGTCTRLHACLLTMFHIISYQSVKGGRFSLRKPKRTGCKR